MTTIKNLSKAIGTITLASLSLASLNFNSAALATTTTTNNLKQSKTLLVAQQATCSVGNIQTGQLALRSTPDGKSKAGLNNGNTVAVLRSGSGYWRYVRVIDGPNSAVNGMEGWVNSNYLSCAQAQKVTCDVVNIQSGQLALRSTPNGRAKAGLNNGNSVVLLKPGSGVWRYVRVINDTNGKLIGMEGWVNANYLSCSD